MNGDGFELLWNALRASKTHLAQLDAADKMDDVLVITRIQKAIGQLEGEFTQLNNAETDEYRQIVHRINGTLNALSSNTYLLKRGGYEPEQLQSCLDALADLVTAASKILDVYVSPAA